jgi:hypothetical protein
VGAGLVFDAALDEKVVSENLGDGSVLLEHVTTLAGFLREGVEEIEGGSIGIHWLVEMGVNAAKMPGEQFNVEKWIRAIGSFGSGDAATRPKKALDGRFAGRLDEGRFPNLSAYEPPKAVERYFARTVAKQSRRGDQGHGVDPPGTSQPRWKLLGRFSQVSFLDHVLRSCLRDR